MSELRILVWATCMLLSASGSVAQESWPSESVFHVSGMPDEVSQIMSRQLEAWNRADLVGFMNGYWESDSLRFVGSNGVTRGHRATLLRYQKGYPDAQSMGKLTFVNEEWISLGTHAGWLVGSWHLQKEGLENAQGMYTLLWRQLDGKWVIVADHSS